MNRFLIFIEPKDYLEKIDELMLLSKESIKKGELDKKAEYVGKKELKKSIDIALLDDITNFREILYNNIKINNKNRNLSDEDIEEAVQRIIDRMIFIRNAEDRGLEPEELRSKVREWSSSETGHLLNQLNKIYSSFDKDYDSKLFEHSLCDDLKIDDDILEEVINGFYESRDGLYRYDFSLISADILGNIYEQYLGRILKKVGKTSKLEASKAKRKSEGIYYTPTYIVDYIVKNTVGEYIKTHKEKDIENVKILDPACGSGSFLLKAYDTLENYWKEKGKLDETKLEEFGSYSKKVDIITKNIFGVDLDEKAVEITQLNLLLKIAEKRKRLPKLQENIKNGNSLIDDEKVSDKSFNWDEKFADIMKNGGFDIVIGNPPYIRIQTLDKKSVNFFNSTYESATRNYDIYVLFVEKALSLLKKGGILSFILPSKFLTADYGEGLRKLIAEEKLLYKIVNFNDFQIFNTATTYTCLLFLKKTANKQFEYVNLSDKDKFKQIKAFDLKLFKTAKQNEPNDSKPLVFVSDENRNILKKIGAIKKTLGTISTDIFQGLVTGYDKIYFVDLIEERRNKVKVRNRYDKKEYLLEKEIVKKLLKGKEIRKWVVDWDGVYIVYPYLINNKKARLIKLNDIKTNYPNTYQYFLNYEKELKSREGGRFRNKEDWHQFGRLQNIGKFEQAKIMTQVLSSRNNFVFDEKGEYYFVGGGNAGGYGIVLGKEYENDYYVILALLNSKLLEFYLKCISTPFRGGFYSYGKRFIKRLPIIIPSDKEKITILSKKQIERYKTLQTFRNKRNSETDKLELEIKEADDKINEEVFNLYRITDEEKKIIEESLK